MFRMAEKDIRKALSCVKERMASACVARPPELRRIEPRLVAVTKTKPLSMVREAYLCGQRHFGENYVAELEEKGKDPVTLTELKDIRWHFIGHLQSNKVNKVVGVPNLWMIETVHSEKVAKALDRSWERAGESRKLKVMLQVNTSRESNKSGCSPEEVVQLMKTVREACSNLHVVGLMTIGILNHDLGTGPNPDFQCLVECKRRVCEELGIDPHEVELSMGMSNDFEHAIEQGSYNVRVGSTIFGARSEKIKSGVESNEADTSHVSTGQSSSSSRATKNQSDETQGVANAICNGVGGQDESVSSQMNGYPEEEALSQKVQNMSC